MRENGNWKTLFRILVKLNCHQKLNTLESPLMALPRWEKLIYALNFPGWRSITYWWLMSE